MPPTRTHRLILALAAALGLVGCGGTQSKAEDGKPNLERDVEVKHEACDMQGASQKLDANNDGRPDLFIVKSGDKETCRAVDPNFDGVVDSFTYFDDQGRVRRREHDFDRDGRPDEIDYFEAGALVRKERETNFDNKLDTWDYYEGGVLARRERDSNGDKIVDQWWKFDPTRPRCAIVTSDLNGDGAPDPTTEVDLCGDGKRAAPPPAPSGSAPVAASVGGVEGAVKPPPSASAASPAPPPSAPPPAPPKP